jgi:prepilin-type N-terminal cleavage/methylation domain-containing protein
MTYTLSYKRKGFTLIELLVVIAIIGVLASVVLATTNTARAKARDARRRAAVQQVKLALEFYFDTNNVYPSIGPDHTGIAWTGLAAPLAPYISRIDEDPSGTTWHTIAYVRGPTDAYGIYMRYESTGYCKTGVNMHPAWWGPVTTVPFC